MSNPPVRQRCRVEVPDGTIELELTLRPGTSDVAACQQVFGMKSYDLRCLRRFGEIAALYRDAAARGRTCLILDLGANIGAASCYFAKAWPASRSGESVGHDCSMSGSANSTAGPPATPKPLVRN